MHENTNSSVSRQEEFPSQLEYDEYVEGRMKGLRLAFASFVGAILPDSERPRFITTLETLLNRGTIVLTNHDSGESGMFFRGFEQEVNEIIDLLKSLKAK